MVSSYMLYFPSTSKSWRSFWVVGPWLFISAYSNYCACHDNEMSLVHRHIARVPEEDEEAGSAVQRETSQCRSVSCCVQVIKISINVIQWLNPSELSKPPI